MTAISTERPALLGACEASSTFSPPPRPLPQSRSPPKHQNPIALDERFSEASIDSLMSVQGRERQSTLRLTAVVQHRAATEERRAPGLKGEAVLVGDMGRTAGTGICGRSPSECV